MQRPQRAMASAAAALQRFTVIDLSRVRAGPTASRQLADWGARVIGIELPSSVSQEDPHVGPRQGSDFRNLNRNRLGMALNLKHPDGISVLRRLVETADVLIENFRPDVKHRLGISYEDLSEINPRLVYASISGFGQEGPYRRRPGFDQIAQGMSGLMSITGRPGEGPLRTGVPIGDLCAGLFCAQGILTALLEREVSGRGQWVQTSLVQAIAFMLDFQAARYLMEGVVPVQHGNDHPTIVPTGTFRTADGHINIAAVGQTMWERLCGALERPDWLADPAFSTNEARGANKDRLHAELGSCLAQHGSAYWVDLLNAHNVPCGPIYRVDEVFADPQFRGLGMVQHLAEGDADVAYLAQPFTLDRTPSGITRHAPGLGEHTDEILESVGYSAEQIQRFRREGVV